MTLSTASWYVPTIPLTIVGSAAGPAAARSSGRITPGLSTSTRLSHPAAPKTAATVMAARAARPQPSFVRFIDGLLSERDGKPTDETLRGRKRQELGSRLLGTSREVDLRVETRVAGEERQVLGDHAQAGAAAAHTLDPAHRQRDLRGDRA